MKIKRPTNRQIYLFVILYNVLATLTVCSLYPSDWFSGYWVFPALMFTFPAAIISFGVRYGQVYPLTPVFIVQTVMLILSLFITWRYVRQRKRE